MQIGRTCFRQRGGAQGESPVMGSCYASRPHEPRNSRRRSSVGTQSRRITSAAGLEKDQHFQRARAAVRRETKRQFDEVHGKCSSECGLGR